MVVDAVGGGGIYRKLLSFGLNFFNKPKSALFKSLFKKSKTAHRLLLLILRNNVGCLLFGGPGSQESGL